MFGSRMFKGKGPEPADLPEDWGEGDVIKTLINMKHTHTRKAAMTMASVSGTGGGRARPRGAWLKAFTRLADMRTQHELRVPRRPALQTPWCGPHRGVCEPCPCLSQTQPRRRRPNDAGAPCFCSDEGDPTDDCGCE